MIKVASIIALKNILGKKKKATGQTSHVGSSEPMTFVRIRLAFRLTNTAELFLGALVGAGKRLTPDAVRVIQFRGLDVGTVLLTVRKRRIHLDVERGDVARARRRRNLEIPELVARGVVQRRLPRPGDRDVELRDIPQRARGEVEVAHADRHHEVLSVARNHRRSALRLDEHRRLVDLECQTDAVIPVVDEALVALVVRQVPLGQNPDFVGVTQQVLAVEPLVESPGALVVDRGAGEELRDAPLVDAQHHGLGAVPAVAGHRLVEPIFDRKADAAGACAANDLVGVG